MILDGWLKWTDIKILDGQWYWTDGWNGWILKYWTDGWDEQILVYCAKGWDERIFDNIVRRDETDNYRDIVWEAETGELWLKGRINWLEMNTDIKIFFCYMRWYYIIQIRLLQILLLQFMIVILFCSDHDKIVRVWRTDRDGSKRRGRNKEFS